MRYTENFEFLKPEPSDTYSVEHQNSNWDKIDIKLKVLTQHVDDKERHVTAEECSNWEKTYQAVLYITDTANIGSAFDTVFTLTEIPVDETALTLEEINQAILTPWNGKSSSDPTAMSSEEIENAISTPWNGESSADETALSAEDIEKVIG